MKHIKRKFQLHRNLSDEVYEHVNKNIEPKIIQNSNTENYVPYTITSEKLFIQSFFYELEGKKHTIVEPNPILIYFSNAQGFFSTIIERRELIFDNLKSSKKDVGDILNHMFAYYGSVVNFVSSLFDSLECLINSKIPKEYIYTKPTRKNKKMNKKQILRFLSFEDKIKEVLPNIDSKYNFASEKSHLFADLKLLKSLRDNITHAKSNIDYEVAYYDALYTEALDFDFKKSIESAKEFINYHENGLIEQCDCGKTH
ncbi:MAG: hypothetical protein COB12_07705 [Flavobacterium sp.]|nr:MAG: hypothetical protein COB12_07705 [Flavobacterium sp.]